MMTTEIVNEIAHLMRQKALSPKDAKEVKVQKSVIEAPQDEVEVNTSAQSYAKAASAPNEYEKEQVLKVERLKSLVQSGNYKMDEDMVATIAERIAKTFI